jgi:hypothetical protein
MGEEPREGHDWKRGGQRKEGRRREQGAGKRRRDGIEGGWRWARSTGQLRTHAHAMQPYSRSIVPRNFALLLHNQTTSLASFSGTWPERRRPEAGLRSRSTTSEAPGHMETTRWGAYIGRTRGEWCKQAGKAKEDKSRENNLATALLRREDLDLQQMMREARGVSNRPFGCLGLVGGYIPCARKC